MTAVKVQPTPPATAALVRLLTSTDPERRAQGEALALSDPSLMPRGYALVELLSGEQLQRDTPQANIWAAAAFDFDAKCPSWLSGRIELHDDPMAGRGCITWWLKSADWEYEHLIDGVRVDRKTRLMVPSGVRVLVARMPDIHAQVIYDAPVGVEVWQLLIGGHVVIAPPPWAWRVIVGAP